MNNFTKNSTETVKSKKPASKPKVGKATGAKKAGKARQTPSLFPNLSPSQRSSTMTNAEEFFQQFTDQFLGGESEKEQSDSPNEQVPLSQKEWAKYVDGLLIAARQGDQKAKQEIEEFLKQNPETEDHLSNLYLYIGRKWVEKTFDEDQILKQLLCNRIDNLVATLREDQSTKTLEEILIQQVSLSQLQLSRIDFQVAARFNGNFKETNQAVSVTNKAHSRLINSIKTLHMLRCLKPANPSATIADNQAC